MSRKKETETASKNIIKLSTYRPAPRQPSEEDALVHEWLMEIRDLTIRLDALLFMRQNAKR